MLLQGGVWIWGGGQELGVGHGLAWGTGLENPELARREKHRYRDRECGQLCVFFFSIMSILEQSEILFCSSSFQMSTISRWNRPIWWFLWEFTHPKLAFSYTPFHPMFNHPDRPSHQQRLLCILQLSFQLFKGLEAAEWLGSLLGESMVVSFQRLAATAVPSVAMNFRWKRKLCWK